MSEMKFNAYYIDDYVLEEGIQRFWIKTQTFACVIEEPHLVKVNVIFLSDKKKGAFVLCPKHHDFFDVSIQDGLREEEKPHEK